MKDWFPFTNYDFYGYLSSGLILLCALDYWATGGQTIQRDQWTFLQGTVAVSLAYVTGQFVSLFSAALLETMVARWMLRPPIQVLLSSSQGRIGCTVGRLFIGRYHAPLPTAMREKIFAKAEKDTGLSRAQLTQNLEEVFMPASVQARQFDDVRTRMDDFRNQYGFNRNMAMTGLIAALFLFERFHRNGDQTAALWMTFALVVSAGMLVRFLKFYSCYAAEILRAYAYLEAPSK